MRCALTWGVRAGAAQWRKGSERQMNKIKGGGVGLCKINQAESMLGRQTTQPHYSCDWMPNYLCQRLPITVCDSSVTVLAVRSQIGNRQRHERKVLHGWRQV